MLRFHSHAGVQSGVFMFNLRMFDAYSNVDPWLWCERVRRIVSHSDPEVCQMFSVWLLDCYAYMRAQIASLRFARVARFARRGSPM